MGEKHICTKEHPYTNKHDYPSGSVHPSAEPTFSEEDFKTGQEYDHYHCPICGLYFSVEIAQ